MKRILLFWFVHTAINAMGQFAPAAGIPGSTAIRADSTCFQSWASQSERFLGYKNISKKDSGRVSTGDTSAVLGKALSRGVLSLGDSGVVTLYFESGLINGNGFDFAVFENAFNDSFLELAHVEISENGLDFYRFPSVSLTQTEVQTDPFGATYPEKIHNLAGKYKLPYGTPFDIEDLKEVYPELPDQFWFVRIVDVIGSIDSTWGTKDSKGNLINDPWPTPFNASGFDLDAVGIIHPYRSVHIPTLVAKPFQVFPSENELKIESSETLGAIYLFQVDGKLTYQNHSVNDKNVTISGLKTGYYWLKIGTFGNLYWVP